MAEESTTTTKSVWEVLDRIAFRGSIFAILVFPFAYLLFWFLNPGDHSLLAAICGFFLALITNVVPIFLGLALSYALFWLNGKGGLR